MINNRKRLMTSSQLEYEFDCEWDGEAGNISVYAYRPDCECYMFHNSWSLEEIVVKTIDADPTDSRYHADVIDKLRDIADRLESVLFKEEEGA